MTSKPSLIRWSGAPTREPSSLGARRTLSFTGNVVQAMEAYASGRARRDAPRPAPGRAHHRHRLRPDDECGHSRRGTATLQPFLKPEPRGHRQHQLADAVHDEGDLRPVPAAPRRSANGQRVVTSSAASTRIRPRQGRLRQPQRAPPGQHHPGEALQHVARSPVGQGPRASKSLTSPRIRETFDRSEGGVYDVASASPGVRAELRPCPTCHLDRPQRSTPRSLHAEDSTRTRSTFWQQGTLAVAMSLVAGAVNASGLLAAGAMTSHMTGNITRLGEGLAGPR